MKRSVLLGAAIFSLFLAIIILWIISRWTANDYVQQDKQTANTLIDGIARFRSDSGRFPKSLDDLVPVYLDHVPTTTRNNQFAFRSFHDTDRGDDYELCFSDDPSKSSHGCCYMWWFANPPNSDGWDCTRGAE